MVSTTMKTDALGWTIVSGQYDDGLVTLYDVNLGTASGHIQYNGIGKIRV